MREENLLDRFVLSDLFLRSKGNRKRCKSSYLDGGEENHVLDEFDSSHRSTARREHRCNEPQHHHHH